MNNNWTKTMQLDEAFDFLKAMLKEHGDKYVIDTKAFESASGVGINITEQDVKNMLDAEWAKNAKDIEAKGWDF